VSPSADAHARAVANLRNALQAVSIQGLRNAARLWNWPIKGVAKAEIVQQLMEHLGNTQEMATAFRGLPLTHRQAAIWLAHMGVVEEPAETLRMVIGITEGRELAKATIAHAITELRQRLIVLEGSYQGIFVPEVYREWLPSAEAAQLLYAGQPTPGGRPEIVPAFNLDQLNQHVEQLLTLIEREQPSLQQAQAASAPAQPAMQPLGQPPAGPALQSHAGIVSSSLLAQWGYVSLEEQNLARTLLSITLIGGLCRVQENNNRLVLDAKTMSAWRELSPAARREHLVGWWASPMPGSGTGSIMITVPLSHKSWDELDLVLTARPRYTLRPRVSWVGRESLDLQLRYMRAWLLNLISALRPDVWYDYGRFLDLIFSIRRDLFLSTTHQIGWSWYADSTRLEASQMLRSQWEETYGLLVVAWLTGPATWLGLVQTAIQDDRVVAFMRPGAAASPAAAPLHKDALRFLPDGRLILRNTWQTGDLRKLVGKIAVETARDRETTTYVLSTEAFRKTLLAGQSAEQVIGEFVGAEFALPDAHADRLREWQGRLGRYQLYDNLGVIEFSDDETLAEIQAMIGWGRNDLYPISPRCLVVLRPDAIPDLVEELRRKGYTPQVKL